MSFARLNTLFTPNKAADLLCTSKSIYISFDDNEELYTVIKSSIAYFFISSHRWMAQYSNFELTRFMDINLTVSNFIYKQNKKNFKKDRKSELKMRRGLLYKVEEEKKGGEKNEKSRTYVNSSNLDNDTDSSRNRSI